MPTLIVSASVSESCSQPGMLQYSSILMVSEFCSESSFLVMCTIPGTLSLAHTHGWWKVIGVQYSNFLDV